MKLFVAFVVVVMSFLVCLAEDSPNPVPSPRKEGQPVQKTSANKSQETRSPDIVSKEPSFPHNRQYSAALGGPNVKDSSTEPGQSSPKDGGLDWMLLFTLALVVVGAIQTLIYYWQSSYMQQGLKISMQTVKAAQDSADVASRSLEVVERASLFAEKWSYNIRHGGQHPAGLFCTLHNTGGTTATLTEGAVYLDVCGGIPYRPDFESLSLTYKGPFTVQAQETLEHRLPFTAEKWKEVKAIIRGDLEVYLYGYITYTDEFGGRHHIRFCLKGEREGQLIPVDEGGYNYHVTEKKNQK